MKFTDEEKYQEGYDLKVMMRLLEFLIPHKILALSILFFIIIATGSNIVTPIIIQKMVDNEIVSIYRKVSLDKLDNESMGKLSKISAKFLFEDAKIGYFFYSDIEKKLDEKVIKNLESQNIIGKKYFIGYKEDVTDEFVSAHKDVLQTEGDKVIILSDDFDKLNQKDRITLRFSHYHKVIYWSLVLLFVLLTEMVFTFLRGYSIQFAGQTIMRELRVKLFSHIQSQSLAFVQTNPVGKLVTRISNDVEAISEFFAGFLVNMINSVFSLTGITIILFSLDVKLSLITLATTPAIIFGTHMYRKYSRIAFRNVRSYSSYINSYIAERINGIEIVKYFVREDKTLGEFDNINEKLLDYDIKEMYIYMIFRPMVDFVATISISIIIYFGATEILGDRISLGVVLAFINLLKKFYDPIMQISESFNILQSAMTSGERIYYFLDTHQEIPDNGTKMIDKSKSRGEIIFENVSFAYKKDFVIKDMSFKIEPGEMIALIGYTGSGKTTITNLITRMWDIQQGSIKFDGTDIREFKLAQLRSVAQSLQQDVFLFNDTIRENILMGETISEDRLNEVIKASQLDDYIASLPLGLNHIVEEGGKNLSAGQKQLISFARIMIQNPHVIIMDEATANIDTETEKKVQKAMEQLMKGKTSIVVAHRLSTIKNANRIFVLKDGHLIESGTHNELLKQEGGMYKNLYTLQYKEENRME